MTHRTTISITEKNYKFLKTVSDGNNSAYINELLEKERIKSLRDAIHAANQEEANDAEYQKEMKIYGFYT